MGNITFNSGSPAKSSQPTVADAIASGQNFQTSFGTVYVRATGGQFVKLGNAKKSSSNEVTVKSADYFNGRQNEPVTLLGKSLNINLAV